MNRSGKERDKWVEQERRGGERKHRGSEGERKRRRLVEGKTMEKRGKDWSKGTERKKDERERMRTEGKQSFLV